MKCWLQLRLLIVLLFAYKLVSPALSDMLLRRRCVSYSSLHLISNRALYCVTQIAS